MILKNKINAMLESDLPTESRVHQLHGYLGDQTSQPVFIKREDELNPSSVGTKLRKYLSLLPFIRQEAFSTVILIGSAYSNNLIGLIQFLVSRSIRVIVLVKDPGSAQLQGNWLFLNMLLNRDRIKKVPSSDWPEVINQAEALADALHDKGEKVLVVPEGGECKAVIPGLLTLAIDIQRNQHVQGLSFTDIWTDSGTGISAIGLLLGLRLLGMTSAKVHITLIAGSEEAFYQRYNKYEQWAEELLGEPIPTASPDIVFHTPATAPSFGNINKTIQRETLKIARETGILMDPVYSVKHFYTVKQQLQIKPPIGPQLVLYNGGPLGLCGFQSMLASQLSSDKGLP